MIFIKLYNFLSNLISFHSITRQGKVVAEIELPVRQVTSMVFAGPNLDTFYVTTAGTDRDGEQPPLSGQLFKITGLGAKGYAGVKVRL